MSDGSWRLDDDRLTVPSFDPNHFSYLTSQLKNELNLILLKADVENPIHRGFLLIVDQLYHSLEETKREASDLGRSKRLVETDSARLNKELNELKNETDLLNKRFKEKERGYKDQLKKLEMELKKALNKEKQYITDLKKRDKDAEADKKAINKDTIKGNVFTISSKHDNKKYIEQMNSADNLFKIKTKNSQQATFESLKDINSRLYDTMQQMLKRFKVFCQPRKDYVAKKLNSMQIEDPSGLLNLAEFDKEAEDQLDEIDLYMVSRVHQSVEGCFKFMHAFDVFLNSDFRDFLDGATGHDESGAKFKEVQSKNSYKHIREVHELQNLLENFNKIVDNQKNIISLQHKVGMNDLGLNMKPSSDKKQLIEKSKQNIADIQEFINKHKKNMEEHDKRNSENTEQLKQAHDKVKEVLELYTAPHYITEEH